MPKKPIVVKIISEDKTSVKVVNETVTKVGLPPYQILEQPIETNKVGSVELTADSTFNQNISLKGDKYVITTEVKTEVTPQVTQGWIDTISPKGFVSMNQLYMDKTELETSFVPDHSKLSGNSSFRVSATAGYNDTKLSEDIDIFQGEIILEGED